MSVRESICLILVAERANRRGRSAFYKSALISSLISGKVQSVIMVLAREGGVIAVGGLTHLSYQNAKRLVPIRSGLETFHMQQK